MFVQNCSDYFAHLRLSKGLCCVKLKPVSHLQETLTATASSSPVKLKVALGRLPRSVKAGCRTEHWVSENSGSLLLSSFENQMNVLWEGSTFLITTTTTTPSCGCCVCTISRKTAETPNTPQHRGFKQLRNVFYVTVYSAASFHFPSSALTVCQKTTTTKNISCKRLNEGRALRNTDRSCLVLIFESKFVLLQDSTKLL